MAFLFWTIVGLFGGSAAVIVGGWLVAERSTWFRKELVGSQLGDEVLGDGNG